MNPVINERIKAGFYVNWDAQSFFSLRENIDKLNLVFPEWLFLQDSSDSIAEDIDLRVLKIMQNSKVKILPMLSNYFNNDWSRQNLKKIISSEGIRKRVIKKIIDVLNKYNFDGINIDFENIESEDRDELLLFMQELFKELHKKNYLVTQDIQIFDIDYDINSLKHFNDFLILMAYDMHLSTSDPGPIADIKWVENYLFDASNKVAENKHILGIPSYGYVWPEDDEGIDITYQEALVTAKESDGKVKFEDNTYNLYYNYFDDNDKEHKVWFTDAATDFNLIRTAMDFGIAGVALWRLGSEDPRLWYFFSMLLTQPGLDKENFDYTKMEIH